MWPLLCGVARPQPKIQFSFLPSRAWAQLAFGIRASGSNVSIGPIGLHPSLPCSSVRLLGSMTIASPSLAVCSTHTRGLADVDRPTSAATHRRGIRNDHTSTPLAELQSSLDRDSSAGPNAPITPSRLPRFFFTMEALPGRCTTAASPPQPRLHSIPSQIARPRLPLPHLAPSQS
ncbi:hypothetical protein L1887_51323 [Cichorium endivia]|nr:hypothetical protein L1887_51323 [Cichorium endivia]